jgi:hypothetical protein
MRLKSFCLVAIVTALILVPGLSAGTCSNVNTDCTYTFDEHNGGFSGITGGTPYGTVELQLVAGVIDVTLSMASRFNLINTGFAGTFGYNDTLNDGTPTAGNFSVAAFSGTTNNGGNESNDSTCCSFDGFGNYDDVAATTGPTPGSSTTGFLTFTISRAGGFTSVQQLVESATGGDGTAFFVVDVFDKTCGANGGTACTGLVGVSDGGGNVQSVPEPTSYAALLAGFGAIAFGVQRRERRRRNTILAE